ALSRVHGDRAERPNPAVRAGPPCRSCRRGPGCEHADRRHRRRGPGGQGGGMSESRQGWFARLRQGLARSAGGLNQNLSALFAKRRLDQASLDELEDVLSTADLGPVVAAEVASRLAESKFGKEVT